MRLKLSIVLTLLFSFLAGYLVARSTDVTPTIFCITSPILYALACLCGGLSGVGMVFVLRNREAQKT